MTAHILDTGSMTVPAEVMIRSGIQLAGELKLAARSLLLEHNSRIILFDPGLSGTIPAEQQKSYGIDLAATRKSQVLPGEFKPGDITDVVLTHLHFDHVAGALKEENGQVTRRFPNARYHLPRVHTLYSRKPDPSESDALLEAWTRGQKLHWIEDWDEPWMRFEFVNGHTPGMAVPVISCPGFDLIYGTDLIPMQQFTRQNVSSGYDLDPDMAMDEKNRFLKGLKRPAVIVLYHDPEKEYMLWPEGSVDEARVRKVLAEPR